ncbi:MAG: DUF1854 domain-containing protein [Ruminococcaceae bacterium]|nr:DUF1854 domain-containing protein [Oscillospiraceae bacterium]
MNEYKVEDFAIDTLRILNVNELKFTRRDSGYLYLEYQGNTYEEISLTRLQPFFCLDTYISVAFRNDEEEWIEIGIIKDLKDMNEEQRQLCTDYLNFRYYIPIITKIYSIKDNRMGYLFVDAETTAGHKKIAVNDWWTNFRINNSGILTVTDSDGNKYQIPDLDRIDRSSYRKLELFV